jgi:hypothetical protein
MKNRSMNNARERETVGNVFCKFVLIKIRLQLTVSVLILNYKEVKQSKLTYITKKTEVTNTCRIKLTLVKIQSNN